MFKRRYSSDEIVVGNIKIDKTKRLVYRDGEQVQVGVKEYELLLYLMENKGKALTKEKLFNTVWGYGSDSEIQTLTVHIKWLREKLEKDSKKPEHILTVWGVGYRFE